MQRNKVLVVSFALLLLITILAILYAGEKKILQKSIGIIQAQSVSNDDLNSQKAKLLEKINSSPEYANLPAEKKVRIIVQELRQSQPQMHRANNAKKPAKSHDGAKQLEYKTAFRKQR
ncbi:hypothetical protein GWO43_25415 [candidate division KSB1 bacterium]|nr:hypothetical protein [candidate division KSB1 bacterium]NIR68917.1 hypothetical protein [candidate division KSB1 bacterium]NIS27265.1 hypothetical protein [candidate division KSB1 bacterium]NIT74150.1 hypothetical protein [candidate division KSB1 bacterium]NIU27999.1 hypothetical protein [candidate division KSB1 bacterium]